MAGLELACALIVLTTSALALLVWGFPRSYNAVDTGFLWTTQFLGTVHVFYDIAVNSTLIVSMFSFRGPARRHELETKRVGTPLHRKYVVVFTVMLSIAMALTATMLLVGFAWRLQSERQYGTSIIELISGLLFDFGWSGTTITALWLHLCAARKAVAFNATHDVAHGTVLPQASIVHGPYDIAAHGRAHQHLPHAVVAQRVDVVAPAPIIITATLVQPAAQQQVPTGVLGAEQPQLVGAARINY